MYFLKDPVVALFVSLAIGYLIGQLRVGPIRLGGVCGTLLAALAIGQLGVRMSADLKDSAFTLFIYALGFTAGPQFFANIRGGWRYGVFSIIEVVCVTFLVSTAIILFKLDIGTATGLFAGSATESAVIGTASQAISHLAISPEQIEQLQANVATAYSLTYLFGLIAIVLFTTQLAPMLLRVDLKTKAQVLARKLGSEDDEENQVEGLPMFVARAFRAGSLAGQTISGGEKDWNWAVTIERVRRHGRILQTDPNFLLKPGDIVIVHGRRNAVIAVQDFFGEDCSLSEGNDYQQSIDGYNTSIYYQATRNGLQCTWYMNPSWSKNGYFISNASTSNYLTVTSSYAVYASKNYDPQDSAYLWYLLDNPAPSYPGWGS